jgi:acetyl-CoA carboxylase biotin carboxyl carrier protein
VAAAGASIAVAPMGTTGAPVAVVPIAVAGPSDSSKHPGAVKSPMVGTAYLSAEPGKPVFVNVGDKIAAGQTLLIIEAMKTFNPIKAPKAGTVTQILIENARPVEFGEVLMIVE